MNTSQEYRLETLRLAIELHRPSGIVSADRAIETAEKMIAFVDGTPEAPESLSIELPLRIDSARN